MVHTRSSNSFPSSSDSEIERTLSNLQKTKRALFTEEEEENITTPEMDETLEELTAPKVDQ